MSRLRLCVIGAGSWVAASHLPNLAQRRDEVEFVGVCRLGETALRHIQDVWHFQVATEDYREVLDLHPDVVIVASPAALHFEHAMAALAEGAHVLVEKPFTLRSADAWSLVRVAAEKDRHLVVSFGYNYRPIVTLAKEALERIGRLGEIEAASVEMASVTRDLLGGVGGYPSADKLVPPDARTWSDSTMSGGGYGQAQLTHALGVLLWVAELRGEEVFAITSSPPAAPVEFYAAAAVRYVGGTIGSVTGAASYAAGANGRDVLGLTVTGSEGELRMECHNDLVRLFRRGTGLIEVPIPPGGGRYDCDGPVHALVDLALGRTQTNASPGELGARTVEVLEALYRSASSGRPESISNRADKRESRPLPRSGPDVPN